MCVYSKKPLTKRPSLSMPPLNKEEMISTFADCSRLFDFIGFKPVTTVETGLKKTVDWYLFLSGAAGRNSKMNKGENIFVFVVCGTREHIDSLHFSLTALNKFSHTKVVIVTDPSRNEIPVLHGEVIAISTPQEYNHHQASIYLKNRAS